MPIGVSTRFSQRRSLLALGIVTSFMATGSAAQGCDSCGCHLEDGAICTPHAHDGQSHSHAGTTVAAPLAIDVSGAARSANVVQRFVVVGDTQDNGSGGSGPSGSAGPRVFMPQMITNINTHSASNLLLAGDLVNTGGNASWNDWIAEAQKFNGGLANVLMTPGNHDQPSGTDSLWRSKFSQTPTTQPWLPDSQTLNGKTGFDQMDYFVDQGSTRFISVTTDTQAFGASNLATTSLDWMKEALKDANSNPAIQDVFVYTHHPVTFDSTYTGAGGGSIADRIGTQGDMWQSLTTDTDKVRALFTGHWHLFQPSKPDPDNPDVWEVVTGTGGGGLEGRTAQNQHGFTLVDILDDGRIEATFYGDADGAINGWDFNDIMDRFDIVNPAPAPAGLAGYYGFNTTGRNLDQATTAHAKQNHGFYNNDAASVIGGVLGRALAVDGNGDYADGASFGDYNLAINGNLTLSIHANFAALAPGSNENTLVTYGSALYDNNTPGSNELESEAVNIAYSLRLRDDKRLEMLWERDNGTDVVLVSSAAANVNADAWHHYVVSRDNDTNQLLFYVDGVQLGAPVVFTDAEQPTGGGSGFLQVGSALYGGGGFEGLLDELTIYNTVILPGQVISGALLGDLDGDSDIDLDDFRNEFLTMFGETLAIGGSAITLAQGDYDLDGDVDLLDFDAFQTYYFDANPGALPLSFHVPEPTTLSLLATMVLLLVGRWRCAGSIALSSTAAASCRPRPKTCLPALATLMLLVASSAQAATVLHDYQFSGNFSDALGGPSLSNGGGTLRLNGYDFGGGKGLSLADWDPTDLGEDYTIEFYARFDVFGNGSYAKLVDFKNRTADRGFYIHNVGGGQRPVFFDVNQNNASPNAFTQSEFHHVVIARDASGADNVTVWLDGAAQWTFDDNASQHAVANTAGNLLHFFVDDGGAENPTGYVDFLRVYDTAVTQSEVNTMVAGLPQYGAAEVVVDKFTGDISVHANNNPEPLQMRGYQLTSLSGALSDTGWSSWDSGGLDGDTWFEANPSTTQLAELNLTSAGSLASTDSRSLGAGYGGGIGGDEDLRFEYLAPGNPIPIAVPITYLHSPVFRIGDLDFDTDIDFLDWNLYVAGLGKDLSGMAMLDAFQMGDMDDDFDNDHNDFLLFRQAYETEHGLGSLAQMLASVPEPSNGLLWLAVGGSLIVQRSRNGAVQVG